MESVSIKARRGTESYLINALYSDYVVPNKPCLPSNKTWSFLGNDLVRVCVLRCVTLIAFIAQTLASEQ